MRNICNLFLMFTLVLFNSCRVSETYLGNIDGVYRIVPDKSSSIVDLPAIRIYTDSTFEYIAPNCLGDAFHSTGRWEKTSRGIRLTTSYKCIGATVDSIGLNNDTDSIDVFFLFIASKKIVSQIELDTGVEKLWFAVDSLNHIRLKYDIMDRCRFVIDDFDYYPICKHIKFNPGVQYLLSITDNPYYPIINGDELLFYKDYIIWHPVDKKRKLKFYKINDIQ